MIKLIVSDFDGTIIRDDLSISIATILKIDCLRKHNILFAIASGRDFKSVIAYNKDAPFLDYVIALNGTYVYDVIREKVIYHKLLPKSIIKAIAKKYENKYNLVYRSPTNSFSKEKQISEKFIYKIEIHCSNKQILTTLFKEITALNLNISLSKSQFDQKDYLLEIVAAGQNKLLGIKKICQERKISLDDVLALGDGENDLEMLENVGRGICMANATNTVKKRIKETTLSNNAGGVEKVLQEIIDENNCQ